MKKGVSNKTNGKRRIMKVQIGKRKEMLQIGEKTRKKRKKKVRK
jgi:hypothetical protein